MKLANLEEQMDSTDEMVISTKCITGHKFKVPKEKIQASSSGKSFVTLCPKCNKVARLRKEDVFRLFGINPRDHVAVGNLFASLTNQSVQPPMATNTLVNGAPFQETVSAGGAKFQKPVPEEDEIDDGDDLEDEEDVDEDREDEDEDQEDDDREYTAQVETVPDVTGKKKTVQRFRTVSDDDEEDESAEDEERERTPVKNKKPAKKARARVRNVVSRDEEEDEEDESDEDEDRRSRRTRRKRRPIDEEDGEMDPNDILKDVVDESGIDEISRDHIFDYIDLQPDGWQPSAIQGVIEMYVSPASARKISQRYQAELYREQKRREREQRLMNMMGAPAGNMRLDDNRGISGSPFNNPVNRGAPPVGVPFLGGDPRDRYVRDQYGRDPYGDGGYRDPRDFNDPRALAPIRRELPSVSPMQVKQMITEEMTTQFEKLQNALTQSKREEALNNELAQMRALVFDVIKAKTAEPGSSQQSKADPLLTTLLANQAETNKTLLVNALDNSKKEDPVQKMIMQELLDLKKARSAPPLTHTTEELTQRIQLQKLANELELAQAEYRDKAEGRVFARDLAGQALTKIGESVATAYLESQRMAAMNAAQSQAMGLTPPPAAVIVPQEPMPAVSAQKSEPQINSPAQPRALVQSGEVTSTDKETAKYHVTGVPQDDGTISIPCPTCGSDIIARPGDTSVSCKICGSTFTAGAPVHEYATGSEEIKEPVKESTREDITEPAQEVVEPLQKMPKGIL